MNSSLHNLVPCFYGRDVSDEGGQQDPTEFIEILFFAIDGQNYIDEAKKQMATRVVFRTHLREKRSPGIKAWLQKYEAKRSQHCGVTREGDKLNAECPEKFRDVLGHQFIAGLDDKRKVDLIQVYLGAQKSAVSYMDARQAVEKAYQRFGELSPFDDLHSQPSSPPPTPVQSELVALLRGLRIPPPAPLRDSPPNRFDYSNANMRDQNGRPTFYRGIHCHNCWEEGHYSTSCTKPVVSGAQHEANRRAIDKLQGGPRQYPRGPGMVPGLPPPQSALAVVASGGVERQKQGGQRINNIGMANVVILKRPTVKETGNDFEHHHKYPIAALTQSHELAPAKLSEPKVLQPTLQVTAPVTRIADRPLAQQVSRNLERLNEMITQPPSLFPPLSEDDDEMGDKATARGDSYGLRDDRFQTEPFLETPVPLPISQCLDQSPQSEVQSAQAIVSSWDFKKEEKSAGPKIIGTTTVAAKFSTPLAIESVAHEEKKGYDRLLLKRWTCKVDWGPGTKTIWGRSIPMLKSS